MRYSKVARPNIIHVPHPHYSSLRNDNATDSHSVEAGGKGRAEATQTRVGGEEEQANKRTVAVPSVCQRDKTRDLLWWPFCGL